MRRCKITINTTVDGQETSFSTYGEMSLSIYGVTVRYQQENATITLAFKGGDVTVDRLGDYSLHLDLKEDTLTKGKIGIGGNEGEIEIQTHKVQYLVGKDSLLASLRYDLLMSGDVQRMQLRILARFSA